MNDQPTRQTNKVRKFILFLIPFLSLLVIIVTIYAFSFNPERQAKAEFETLAQDYYENVFYEKMLRSANFSGDTESALQKYQSTGLSPLTLRDLILLDRVKSINQVLKYCNQNTSTITFFPEPPYSRTDYRIEYTYSCNF